MTDPLRQLKSHADEGGAHMKRLKYAASRDEAARHVRILRRWHRDLQPLAKACGITLRAGDGYYPTEREATPVVPVVQRPRVVNRHGNVPEAQRIMLAVTAAALSRLAHHLSNAKPMPVKAAGGRPPEDPQWLVDAITDELHEMKRRGERPVKDRAIRNALKANGYEEGSDAFERAHERLKKRLKHLKF